MTDLAAAMLAAMRKMEARGVPDDPPQPTILPGWLYDAAKAQNIDLSNYVRQQS